MSKARFAMVGVLFAAMIVSLGGCSKAADPWDKVPGSPRVLVTFPPLYCFTKNVAGDDAAVISMLTTLGPHDHKFDDRDALLARRADLFLVNGLALDDFTTKIVNNSNNLRASSSLICKIGDAIPREQLIPTAKHDHKHAPGEVCPVCSGGEFDPHVWLGIDEAVLMVEHIARILSQENPSKKDAYHERAAKYVAELRKLQEEGKAMLAGKKDRKFIVNHDSFRYFARSFGLESSGSIQARPGVEADPQQMAKLIEVCQKGGIRVVGVEPQYRRSGAETLQAELKNRNVDIAIVTLDPLETATPSELDAGWYVRGMRANLKNLADHLQ